MSQTAQRTVFDRPIHRLSTRLPNLGRVVPATALVLVAAFLLQRWWIGSGAGIPSLSLAPLVLTGYDVLFQLPGLVVLGLLVVRMITRTGGRTIASEHLADMTARWAWIWAGATVLSLIATAMQLTDGSVLGLAGQDNLITVVGSSDRMLAAVGTLWVGLTVASFGVRLRGLGSTVALGVLTVAALLPVNQAGGGGSHGGHQNFHQAAVVAVALQLVAFAIWSGALVTMVLHLRHFPLQLRQVLPRFATIGALSVLVVGLTGLVQTALLLDSWSALWSSVAGNVVLIQALTLLLLTTVGYRHRRRTSDVAASGRLLPLLGLAAGEVVLMGASVAVTALLSAV